MAMSVVAKPPREQIIEYNRELARYASRKDLSSARELYDRAQSEGWANTHTYCSMINACVRCGDMNGGREVFAQLKNRKFEPDVVSYTTMMKGYCQEGNIEEAKRLFDEMIDISTRKKRCEHIRPNIRTINTLLRGCVVSGSVLRGESFFSQLKSMDLVADISSSEMILSLFCQALNLDKALPMIGRLSLNSSTSSGLMSIYINVARAACIVGDWKLAKKSLKSAQEAILVDESFDESDQLETDDLFDEELVTGGKKPWQGKVDDASRVESLKVFRTHRRNEASSDCNLISSYLESSSSSSSTSDRYLRLVPAFIRFLSFSWSDAPADKSSVIAGLVEGINDKIGFSRLLDRLHQSTSSAPIKLKCSWRERYPSDCPAGLIIRRTFEAFENSIDESGRIDLATLLSSSSSSTSSSEVTRRLPIKLEICAGAGEWAVAQARADPRSHWATLELRHDRAYQTLFKLIISGVENMTVLAGDAMNVLPNHWKDATVSHVFVNHPEPPQQTSTKLASQGKHLLTASFFHQISRVLVDEGRFTILTDNLWYAKLLLKDMTSSSFPSDLSSVALDSTESYKVEEESGGFHLYNGQPGATGGHICSASSYFDRLWKKEEVHERFFFVLEKRANAARALQILSKKRLGLFSSSANQQVKNKKIKFDDN